MSGMKSTRIFRREKLLWCVYALREPTDLWTIRYIGCTAYPENRLDAHISGARTSTGCGSAIRAKNSWINNLLARGEQPEFDVLYLVADKELAYRLEAKLQEVHAATIFNPRRFPSGQQDDVAMLLGAIEHLSSELYAHSRHWNSLKRRIRNRANQETCEFWATLAREEADMVRRELGLLPLNPGARRKQRTAANNR